MLLRARSIGLIEGVLVGKENVDISHLQYANDMIIFSPAKGQNLQNIRRILDCFTIMSGLYINYSKTSLIPICCDKNWVVEMANSLPCKMAKLPIFYLGIPFGANPRKISTWKLVVEKIEKRLAMWKNKSLFRAGRLTLIKLMVNNMPVYYMGLFKV